MKYYLDVKHTVWTRQTFSSLAEMEDIREKFEDGEFRTSEDAYDYMEDFSAQTLEETFTEMNVYDNDGESTIEIVGEDGSLLFKNN